MLNPKVDNLSEPELVIVYRSDTVGLCRNVVVAKLIWVNYYVLSLFCYLSQPGFGLLLSTFRHGSVLLCGDNDFWGF